MGAGKTGTGMAFRRGEHVDLVTNSVNGQHGNQQQQMFRYQEEIQSGYRKNNNESNQDQALIDK